jgi:hypothetical protein
VANGVAPLGADNKIPSIHLPGGVDDIKEFANLGAFPATGEASIIYVALDTNKIYRWSGSAYVEISSSLALGTTSSTAFAGDRGLATETKTNNIVSGVQGLTDTRITNSAVGVVPVIVNAITSTTADLQQWQRVGSPVAGVGTNGTFYTSIGIRNATNANNSAIDIGTNGTLISRNVNDVTNINPALTINQTQGAGDITRFQFGGANKLEITKDGFLNQNGTRLFHQTAGTTNTFFGTSSGNLTLTGDGNSVFGYESLPANTSGSNNVALGRFVAYVNTTGSQNVGVGWASLFGNTTGNNNMGIGTSAGRTITTGSNNTFIGAESGYTGAWGTQLATASNSTAIGYQAFTDANNQMVFGNASVTQFKFDRNASAVLNAPQISATSPNIHTLERTTDLTFAVSSPSVLRHKTSGDMTDGFGAGLLFAIQDNAGVSNLVSRIATLRSGADTSGRLTFTTYNAGSDTEKMTIMPDGKVGIGTVTPGTTLNIAKATEVALRLDSGAFTGFLGLSGANGTLSNNSLAGDLVLRAETGNFLFSNGTTERMRILSTGLVGINETTISAQLQVKSGATTRIPLIVDTLASHTNRLQDWRVNGSSLAYILASGRIATVEGITNGNDSNFSYVNTSNNGTIISRNVADSNPALIVNLANSSATGNIVVFQKAGTALSQIDNAGNFVSAFTERTQIITTDQVSDSDSTIWTTAFTSPTLDANAYYEIELVGVHSKTSTNVSTRLTIGFILNNISGSPTFTSNGDCWSGSASTSVNTFGIDTTAVTGSSFNLYTGTTGTFGIRPFSVRGVLFTGDSTKTITTQHRNSATITSGSVTLAKGTYIKYRRIA